jgi:protein TonB
VPALNSNVIDIRGIWKNTKLDKKGAAARGLVASEIQTPRKVKNVPPEYPIEPRRARIQGTVFVECIINTAGVPTECKVTRGPDPRLNDEGLRCVKEWRFKPLLVRGEPASALVEFTVSFRLD